VIWQLQSHVLVHIEYSAQRWIAFQDMGPSPSGRWAHAMGSDGTRVFVLGGILLAGTQADEAKLIHVLETSMYSLFCHFIWTASEIEHRAHQVPRT